MNMMKRLISFFLVVTLFLGMVIVPNGNTVQSATKADKAKKEYKKILNSMSNSVGFWCYDINHDGVLELLLDEDGVTSQLYYYYKNKIKKASVSSYFACYKKGGVFCCFSMRYGYESEGYNIISNGKVKMMASMIDDSGADSVSIKGPQYYIGKKKVSKSKFNSYIKRKTKNSKTIQPKWHKVTKTNINKYLK